MYLTGPQGILSICIVYVLSFEYQMHGLPHLHCLLWISKPSKPRPQNDRFVQAEIPDELVLKHMIHGLNYSIISAFWKGGQCSKRCFSVNIQDVAMILILFIDVNCQNLVTKKGDHIDQLHLNG